MQNIPPPQNPIPTGPARFLGAVFGLIFFGIGITVIGFLWGLGGDGFDGPPVVFKIFGSFIALGFVAMGGTLAVTSIFGGGMIGRHRALIDEAMRRAQEAQKASATSAPSQQQHPPSAPAMTGYACPHCGGTLGQKADVSPMGDAKCAFCGRWFNVHGRG
jgi:hypothetical protein